ncbi:hypothetical protein ASU91_04505 [Enterobacter hormaechei subsp. steigerwaltii]|uniref:hypothetical protein n=1 Tax=Enterobacteriaceae TaxID=543 RepID=UPI0005EE4708|nr:MULTISPECIES: hypothetical protein [Enterobacteriaceae]MCU2634387.1 hypothetical protein [Enterobacter hormaechei subsp. hoffmannii]KJL72137.1 hypothetical protein SS35_21485 [Enterobacter hormaechei subsp. steigerwaltii]KJL79342.1 hypothetical protein SS61_23680 [Enterobacter hormaechei subsp. steigerwaltii]KJL80330.1 hypothetical protein SS24_17710 [Enterobacter hormaechei subsp. steigerwaltii]KJW80743.1 hypothetical protein SG70_16205 [Enterobacter hormaechei subsp. steigerwaltii]
MSNIAISKKSIIDAAVVIANELQVAANNATQTYNNHYQNGTHTKADKANMLAATTKLAYFTNNVLNAVNDEKLAGVFYYAIKASKQAPEVFFREAMTNSYSLEKLVYLVKSIKSGKCVYSVADMSGSRVFALIEMINDEMETFTNGAVFDLMNEAKKACEIKLDAGYTQANQLINLCERLGLVEKIKGMGAAKNGSQQYRFIKNDFYNYLSDAFKA